MKPLLCANCGENERVTPGKRRFPGDRFYRLCQRCRVAMAIMCEDVADEEFSPDQPKDMSLNQAIRWAVEHQTEFRAPFHVCLSVDNPPPSDEEAITHEYLKGLHFYMMDTLVDPDDPSWSDTPPASAVLTLGRPELATLAHLRCNGPAWEAYVTQLLEAAERKAGSH